MGARLLTTYGGIALTVPANRVETLLGLPGVVAVQRDSREELQTDSSPSFIGAPTIYGQLGQTADDAGKGVIVGVLDTGGWPEHPSYVDHGNLPAPPPKADGSPRVCDFGDNPLTPAHDPFACQDKLISGEPFLDTYNAIEGNEPYPDSARDSNGHGTHTSTTAAGGPVAHADPLGIDRGAIHGVAPGAHVAVYKVCGPFGCIRSDTVAAVGRAIEDGVQVLNYSISGGEDPFSDPVELAFRDAYEAGIVVSTSAGNTGPFEGSVNHRSPWLLATAASSQPRTFRSTISLSGGGAALQLSGATITAGVTSPLPVVRAEDPPYSDPFCFSPAPAGLFTGKIVACDGTFGGRVAKGFNVSQGGAAGMILYNGEPWEVATDNHWLPTVHIDSPETGQLLNFLESHPGATASFPQGTRATRQGDRVAYFSSRGPGGDWLKPDISAPGQQIMAGTTPTTFGAAPPGNLFQVIAGTSMASPHVAGTAALLAALHPTWSAGQIKSALEATARTAGVTKEDGSTPADPFDVGSGRVDLTRAGDPGLTFDETATRFASSASTPLDRIDINTPSVNAPTMPGVITTTRTAWNTTGSNLTFKVTTEAPTGASISVSPRSFAVGPGRGVSLAITISAPSAPSGQYFGRINLEQQNGARALHMPVAFVKRQGVMTLAQSCAPSTIKVRTATSTCSVTVESDSASPADVTSVSTTSPGLRVTEASGATRVNDRKVTATATLVWKGQPTISPGFLFGYFPLDLFGVEPIEIGDEEALNFDVPPFEFAGKTYTRLGVVSNGYLVAGGASEADIRSAPQTLPDPASPNNVLAPLWSDLDGAGVEGVYVVDLGAWIAIEWRVNYAGTSSRQVFQAWIGYGGPEDITFAYDPLDLPDAPPDGLGLTVGAENADGSQGTQIAPTLPGTPPTEDLRVTSVAGEEGTLSYTYTVVADSVGSRTVRTDMTAPTLVRGTTTDVDTITVTP